MVYLPMAGYMAPSPLPNHWADNACLDFVNSTWADHLGSGVTYDRLVLPQWRAAFLERWGLAGVGEPSDRRLERLIELRALLRRLLTNPSAGEPEIRRLDAVLSLPRYRRRLSIGAGALEVVEVPDRRDWDWVRSEIARSFVELQGDAGLRRVKVCANPYCTWIFQDSTRNRSRRFCEANICGNLLKVRKHRARRP
jgi:predicted RNA-binding Zn ribbon-like protein